MRFYVEHRHGDKWLSLASFPTDREANDFAYRMHKAGMQQLRIIALKV